MLNSSLPNFEKYEIIEVLGQGSMGSVYLAKHKMLGRQVALKVPRLDVVKSKTAVERFLREGRALAMLDHQHIVRIYDADLEGDVPFIAMVHVSGGTLSDRIFTNKQLPVSQVISWGYQLADALVYIHKQGILHRDLKSSNVLVTQEDTVQITDFGIAYIEDQSTLTQGMLGTPAYMSPEQAKGDELDFRSDIYSFGVILYEVLTGDIPFFADNTLALIQQIIKEDPRPVTDFRPDLPEWLSDLIMQCLQKNPDNRPQTAQVLLDSLQVKNALQRKHTPAIDATIDLSAVNDDTIDDDTIDDNSIDLQNAQPEHLTTKFKRPIIAFCLIVALAFTVHQMTRESTIPEPAQQEVNLPVVDSTATQADSTADVTQSPKKKKRWNPWPD